MKSALIIVNYKNASVTVNCIKSFQRMKQAENDIITIIVVDNKSEGDDLAVIGSALSEQDMLIALDKNYGYFSALNRGLDAISNYDYVIIGNNDLEFDPSFIDILCNLKLPENAFVIAPNISRPDGSRQNPHCISRISRFRRLIYDVYYFHYFLALFIGTISKFFPARQQQEAAKASSSVRIKMGYGACYVLPRKYLSVCKRLPETVFLMGEEAILSDQVERAGGEIWYSPELLVTHLEHSTFKNIPSRRTFEYGQRSYRIIRDLL